MEKFLIYLASIFLAAGLLSCSSSFKAKSFPLDWPSKTRRVSRAWSYSHDGIDIPCPTNSPVYASHSGQVIAAKNSDSYGRYIILEFSKKWATLYAHLGEMSVKRGDFVQKGQKIAVSGSSGLSHGAHLHFELIKNKKAINPMPYLQH